MDEGARGLADGRGEPPGHGIDEASLPGAPEVMRALAETDLRGAVTRAADHLRSRGVGFRSGAADDEFLVDPVPRVISGGEWERLAPALAQRARALNAFICDVYGDREILAAGRVPEHVVDGAEHHEPDLNGVDLGPAPATIVGFDLVRGSDGRLVVLEDNLRTPSGMTYAVAARAAVDVALPVAPPARLDPAAAYGQLRGALEQLRRDDGEIVLLSAGERSGAWYEHRELGDRLGIPVITQERLRLRGDGLVAELDGGERPVAVVYRRGDEEALREPGGGPTWAGDVLLPALRAGSVVVANALGTGVADDKLAHAYVEEMIRFYLGEDPLIGSVTTYDLSREEVREEMLDRIEEIVVKPRSGLGGSGVYIGPRAGERERAAVVRAIRERPEQLIAQETVALSTHPTVIGDRLEPRHVDLRAYAIAEDIAPAALTRFAPGAGDMVVNSSGGGGGKDTWVLVD